MKTFDSLTEQEILALAISLEEEDARIYGDFADGLQANYPEQAEKFRVMRREEDGHRHRLLELYKPAIFCAGIKEKYAVQKMGIPCKQLHSYDSGGPYAGFKGAINFYREIDRMVNMKVWSFIKAPWQQPVPHPEQPQAAAD